MPYRACVSFDFIGAGTVLNVVTVLVGALIGLAVGQRLPGRIRSVVTDCLGLVTLLIAGLSCVAVVDPEFVRSVGSGAPVLVVLGSVVIGSITGSGLRIEERLAGLAGVIQARVAHSRVGAGATTDHVDARERFVEGWLTTTLLFGVGPLTILGTLSDGLGQGIELLALKSVMDGFAAIAFAASFGIGVLFSAVSVGVIQGLLTVAGVLLGAILPDAHIAALTATGGLLLAGLGIRLLRIRDIPVADMLPALLVAPVLTQLVVLFR